VNIDVAPIRSINVLIKSTIREMVVALITNGRISLEWDNIAQRMSEKREIQK
jgi:hypothetical protein